MSASVVNIRSGAAFDVYIGRASRFRGKSLKPEGWGNPFVIGKDGTRDEVIAKYRRYILGRPELIARLDELVDKTLGCWCAPLPCHGDVLAELVAAKLRMDDGVFI